MSNNFSNQTSLTLLNMGRNYYENSSSFVPKQVLSRVMYLAGTIVSPITLLADTGVAVIAKLIHALTLNKFPDLAEISASHFENTFSILAIPLAGLIRTINPNAKFDDLQNGFLTKQVFEKNIKNIPFIKIFGAQVADTIIGSFVGIVALATLGNFPKINTLAYNALHSPGIIKEIFERTK